MMLPLHNKISCFSCKQCFTFMFLILWIIAKDQHVTLTQELYQKGLHFPQLRKPTPINHFHPKHKPVYQEIFRPSYRDQGYTEHSEVETVKPFLHGHFEYPLPTYPRNDDSNNRRIDSNDVDFATTAKSINDHTIVNQDEDAVLQTVKSPGYTYVPSTENHFGSGEEITTSYMVNVPVSNTNETEAYERLRSEYYHANRKNKRINGNFEQRKKDRIRNSGLHQKMPDHADVLLGQFSPKHPKRYHEIRRGSNLQDASDRSDFLMTTTIMPYTVKPDTLSTVGERNTTIISIQELANRFTTPASFHKTERNLKRKRIPEYQNPIQNNYYTTNGYSYPKVNTEPDRHLISSDVRNKRIETQVKNPYTSNSQGEFLRLQQSQRAYGDARQRPEYESVSPSISPPQYYEIDYDDRVSPKPRATHKYKWDQPTTESIRSLNSYDNLYQQSPPPKRYHQIQRTRQSHPINDSPALYSPIPTYPSTVESRIQAAERRNEYVDIDKSTSAIISTQETLPQELTTLPKKVNSKGRS